MYYGIFLMPRSGHLKVIKQVLDKIIMIITITTI